MQDTLKIALIQSNLVWENAEYNRENFAQKIVQIKEHVDVIVLPEMFTTGFTMNPSKVAETMHGDSVNWMMEIAKRENAVVCGSLVIDEHGKYYNRFVFMTPEGIYKTYDKRHTFTLAGEDKEYATGMEKVIVDYKGWKICPLVCYDLRFPVWARNVEEYDVLIYVANWPKPRINAWDALLKARAIENMSYCVGVNRVGLDENKNAYSGHSAVYDGLGSLLTDFEEDKEGVRLVKLDRTHLAAIRSKLRFLDDKDAFSLEV